jgi:hypothetical protein
LILCSIQQAIVVLIQLQEHTFELDEVLDENVLYGIPSGAFCEIVEALREERL